MEFIFRATASVSPLTSLEMVAANGVLTSPHRAPNNPANTAMAHGEDPVQHVPGPKSVEVKVKRGCA